MARDERRFKDPFVIDTVRGVSGGSSTRFAVRETPDADTTYVSTDEYDIELVCTPKFEAGWWQEKDGSGQNDIRWHDDAPWEDYTWGPMSHREGWRRMDVDIYD